MAAGGARMLATIFGDLDAVRKGRDDHDDQPDMRMLAGVCHGAGGDGERAGGDEELSEYRVEF